MNETAIIGAITALAGAVSFLFSLLWKQQKEFQASTEERLQECEKDRQDLFRKYDSTEQELGSLRAEFAAHKAVCKFDQ